MARMKFLCDADRCIDCNACVTACKNENEVPWGINRRRVVTINDGKPGERSVSMACMHCTDAPCAAVCPVTCIYPTEDGIVLHNKDSVHRLRLLLLCLSVSARRSIRRLAISARAEKWTNAPIVPAAAELKRPRVPRNSRSTDQTVSAKASCRYAPRCARPNLCWPAMATSLRKSMESEFASVGTAQVPGAGRQPITRTSNLSGLTFDRCGETRDQG